MAHNGTLRETSYETAYGSALESIADLSEGTPAQPSAAGAADTPAAAPKSEPKAAAGAWLLTSNFKWCLLGIPAMLGLLAAGAALGVISERREMRGEGLIGSTFGDSSRMSEPPEMATTNRSSDLKDLVAGVAPEHTIAATAAPVDTSALPAGYPEILAASLRALDAQRSGALSEDPTGKVFEWKGDNLLEDGADVGLDLSGGYFEAGSALLHPVTSCAQVPNASLYRKQLRGASDRHTLPAPSHHEATALRQGNIQQSPELDIRRMCC